MELKWMEDYLTLARLRSFSRAARERNVTQPAFSRRIKALEHWVGAVLVDRSTYPMSLTPAGQRFYETAIGVVATLHQERSELRGEQDDEVSVSFAAPHGLSTYLFPPLLQRIERRVGELRVRFVSDNLHDCVDRLVQNWCDFLLTHHHDELPLVLDPERYRFEAISQDRLMPVAAPAGDEGPAFRLPEAGDVQAPVLLYDSGSYLGRALEHLLAGRQSGLRRVVYENALTEALKAMALSRRGIAWLPESCMAPEIEARILVPAGGEQWHLPLEIRIYRSAVERKPIVDRIWRELQRELHVPHAS